MQQLLAIIYQSSPLWIDWSYSGAFMFLISSIKSQDFWFIFKTFYGTSLNINCKVNVTTNFKIWDININMFPHVTSRRYYKNISLAAFLTSVQYYISLQRVRAWCGNSNHDRLHKIPSLQPTSKGGGGNHAINRAFDCRRSTRQIYYLCSTA